MRSHRLATEAMSRRCQQPTLPSGVASATLALAATSFRVATVSHAVGNIAGFPLPVGFTLTEYRTGGVSHTTFTMTGAVVGTCIHPRREEREKNTKLERKTR